MQHYFTLTLHTITLVKIFFQKGCSLCLRWSFFITPDLSFLLLPSQCCLLPRWALTAYLPCFLGGQALPHPFFQADPISLRSQATPPSYVGHIYYVTWKPSFLGQLSRSHGHEYPSSTVPCCSKTVACERNNQPPWDKMCQGMPKGAGPTMYIVAN
jgi:hypothetical protein